MLFAAAFCRIWLEGAAQLTASQTEALVCVSPLPAGAGAVRVLGCEEVAGCRALGEQFYAVGLVGDRAEVRFSPLALHEAARVSRVRVEAGRESRTLEIQVLSVRAGHVQETQRFHAFGAGAALVVPEHFPGEAQLCFDVDARADSARFALRVEGSDGRPRPADALWDPEFACLEIPSPKDLHVSLEYLDPWAPAGLRLSILTKDDEGLAAHERLVQANEGGVLRLNAEYYPRVHVARCADERCLATGENDEVQVVDHMVDLNQLEEGWYALVGLCALEGPCPAGRVGTYAGPIAVGAPQKYRAKFHWGRSVSLLLVVAVVWAVWAVFDRMMKRGR